MNPQLCLIRNTLRRFLPAALLSCWFGAGAVMAAADADPATGVRARCPYGQADNGSRDCMTRAEFVLTRSRQAVLDADPAQYQRNGLVRCERLSGDDRNDCIARINGQGTRSGSVEGGGLYRELVTVVPGVAVPIKATP